MSSNSKSSVKVILKPTLPVIFLVSLMLHKTLAIPYDILKTDEVLVKTATAGKTVILRCRSNDLQHNFIYWHYVNKGLVIGPANDYDDVKYKYEILSGNLTIRGISKDEEGLYECVSRAVKGNDLNIKMVEMIVEDNGIWSSTYNDDNSAAVVNTILVVLIVLVMVAAGMFFAYKMWTDRGRYARYMETNNDDDDDDSTEELFRAPSTSSSSNLLLPKKDIVQKKPQTENAFADIDISTDFKSILDTANDK